MLRLETVGLLYRHSQSRGMQEILQGAEETDRFSARKNVRGLCWPHD